MTGGSFVSIGGSLGANPFVTGGPPTPYISELADGAEVYGLAQGSALTSPQSDLLVQSAINNASPNALVAVVREHVASGLATDPGSDAIFHINLTSVTLANFPIGLAEGASAATSAFSGPLGTGGVLVNTLFGGTGTPVYRLGVLWTGL